MGADGKVNLLIVDDRQENLLALEAIIERADYNVIKASSGEEALKYLLKYDFATILLDVQMPGIDGFATAKIIKAREKTKNIPIIFITANSMDSEHIFIGYSIGAIDYILKPFDPNILKAKVQGFVEIYKMNQKLIHQADALLHMTSELRESEALANVISETSIDSMIVLDNEGTMLKVNPAVKTMFQYDETEIVGQSIGMLFACESAQPYLKRIMRMVSNAEDRPGSETLDDVNATRKDGRAFPVEVQIGKQYVRDKCIVACTIRDIEEQKQYQELIAHMAYHDGLTDLPNRRLFNDEISSKISQAKQGNHSLAVMYLDMDRFKYINDSLGHLVGDRLLREIAGRLKSGTREEDIVARIGGDEFNIILPDTNREHAIEIAEGIMESFRRPFHIDNYELFITTSIGISVFPYDGEDSSVLLKNADAALYRAKEHGKNTYKLFHSGMNMHSYRTFILQNDMRKAVERGELSLVYQPRMDIQTGLMKSAEALLRWNHPSWGPIAPSEFIPLAEETGQIVEIGAWVLKTACRQSSLWQKAGFSPLRIAVNFSAQQFLQKNLVALITEALQEYGLSAAMLEVEITESAIMENEAIITKTLNQLRALGVCISIDDFGTGYSSLNYLRRFPVHTLKIDKSFIQDISIQTPSSVALIASIVSLAHSLNMSVIAEGVETEEQLNVLTKHSCEEIQGYLFCRPIPPEELELRLSKPQSEHEGSSNKISYLDKKQESPHSKTAVSLVGSCAAALQNGDAMSAALNRTQQMHAISKKEIEIFEMIVNGLSNKEISDQLLISENALKNHIAQIFQKLNVNDRLQAMAKVYQTFVEEGKKLRA